MKIDQAIDNILKGALKSADSAEVYVREISSTSVSMRLGLIKEIAGEKKLEISLRLIHNGKMGSAVATQLDDPSLIDRALLSLKYQNTDAPILAGISPRQIPHDWVCDEKVKAMGTEDLVDIVKQAHNRLMKKAPQISSSVYGNKELKTLWLKNSQGFDGTFEQTHISLGLSTLTDQGFYGAGKEYAGAQVPILLDEHIDQLIELHNLSHTSVELGNEKLPVVFSGQAMGALMMRVMGGVHGGNVLKGISPVAGKLGQRVMSDKISIADNGHYKLGINTRPFDDEGFATQNTPLYDRGVLVNYLVNASQANKLNEAYNLNLTPTGNSFKRALFSQEIEDAPSIFETNLIVSGTSIDDALLLSQIKRGLLVTGVMGAHTGNIIGGEFSLNISSGYLIEEGKLVGKVKGSMIAGNIYQLFNEVEVLGTELEPMRSIFYHMGYSPRVKFKEVSIVGK